MSIMRWDPFGELHALRHHMNRFLAAPWFRGFPGPPMEGVGPRMDIYQTDQEVVATAELPGVVSKDDVEVTLTDNTLSIKGEFKRNEEQREENFFHSERYFGTFSRTLPLPAEVKPDQARATFKNGVLEIRMPKKEQGKGNIYRVDIH
ncbi:MAG TPA: Hsp20/alpha crystallin family protein [Desulfotomaculum sp.]|nr:Hsp20/alpha crystallin family protein [Desulfotomaculum sp.]